MDDYRQAFDVSFEYPVVFTRGVFHPDNMALRDAVVRCGGKSAIRILVYIDAGINLHQPGLMEAIESYSSAHSSTVKLVKPPIIIKGGEEVKNDYRQIMEIVDTILEYQMCRHSCVIAVGGGAVLDAVGFAASIVHRGLRIIRLPSTVLAQNDAGIGIKNGMNLHGGKNTIGTFHPPHAVINDLDLLKTLDDVGWRGGIAEAFKVAIIKDADFFDWLTKHATRLRQRDEEAMQTLIRRCAELHLQHIRESGDPFETGTARPLDFGHWAAHKLETMSSYRIGHGQAVAAGIALDACYAEEMDWISSTERDAILVALYESGLPVWYSEMGRRLGDDSLELCRGLAEFQKHLGGDLAITFPKGIGQSFESDHVDPFVLESCVLYLKALTSEQADAYRSSPEK